MRHGRVRGTREDREVRSYNSPRAVSAHLYEHNMVYSHIDNSRGRVYTRG